MRKLLPLLIPTLARCGSGVKSKILFGSKYQLTSHLIARKITAYIFFSWVTGFFPKGPAMKKSLRILAVLALVGLASPALAEDRYFAVKLSEVSLTQGTTLPAEKKEDYTWTYSNFAPFATAEGAEAYIVPTSVLSDEPGKRSFGLADNTLVIRAPEGQTDIVGRLTVPKADWSAMVVLPYKVPATLAKTEARKAFYLGQKNHFEKLLNRQTPGAAYFRYQLHQAEIALEQKQTDSAIRVPWRDDSIERTYGLFTGGRAVAENLQLDRAFRTVPAQEKIGPTIPLSAIEGITVKPFDWAPLIKDLHPTPDPLAALVPGDQHALFFPSFEAFSTMLEQADQQSLPLLQLTEPRSEDALTKQRYQQQLGLSLSAVGKVLGPSLVASVAVTGSDPYLRVGGDVAILFEAKGPSPEVLRQAITTQITARFAGVKDIQNVSLKDVNAGWSATGMVTMDRTISSYIATFGNTVVVTNSVAQLVAIAQVFKDPAQSLSRTPEYIFFRQRYARGEADETALLVLSDATIRRWCGPRVRIADARRTAALAILTDITAARMAQPTTEQPKNPYPAFELGELSVTPTGLVRSSLYNTIAFIKPISELKFDTVTPAEKQAYERWRDSYQNGYSQYFDPIAVRFVLNAKQFAADVTVMPLIEQSDYNTNEFFRVTKGAQLKPNAGDPHNALMQLVLAINPEDELFTQGNRVIPSMVGGLVNPLAWLGNSVSLYADEDPFWAEMAKADNANTFLEAQYPRLPLGLRVESKNQLKLAVFLTAMRAYADQSAPNMTSWETRTHAGQSYVCITPHNQRAEDDSALGKLAIYYAPTPDALVITLSEPLIKRALERYAASTQPATAATQPSPFAGPWLGTNVALHIDRNMAAILQQSQRKSLVEQLQTLAWGNIPILNELKRLNPQADAVALYTEIWQTSLLDPAGGKYVWNAQDQTYESTTLGHPAAPKTPTVEPAYLRDFSAADFGLTFEADGLRAKVQLHRAEPGAKGGK